MRENIRSILAAALGYAAAVIGAGFASGQEIVSFFVRHGKYGFVGIVVSCLFFALYAYAVMSACIKYGIHTYTDLTDVIFKNKALKKITSIAVLVCSGASLCVMIACMGEVAFVVIGTSPVIGSAVFTAVLAAIFMLNARKITGINSFLGLVITVGIIFVCYYILRFREHQTFSNYVSASVSGFAYAGYNLLGTGAILAYMSRSLKNKTDAALSSAAGAVALFVMITLIWAVLGIYYGKINLGEIPMLTMALRQNYLLGALYSSMLAAAVLTTAISSGFALIDIIGKKMPRKITAVSVILGAFCISGAGFSFLIDNVYKVCGYVGIVIVILTIIKALNKVKNEENQRK